MKSPTKFKVFRSLPFFFFVTFFLSCSESDTYVDLTPYLFSDDEGKTNLTKDQANAYILATSGVVQDTSKASDEIRIYVDKSSGINEAFNSSVGGETSKKQLMVILNTYKDSNFKYYGVLKEISPFDLGGKDATNYFPDGKNYNPTEKADLTLAMNTIAAYNGLSFFVTDGEEFDKGANPSESTFEAWASGPLKTWISKGNSVHFWITDFKALGKFSKHLFFMAFVPAKLTTDRNFMNLVKELNSINSQHLELTNTSWSILQPEWSEQSTGLDENLIKDVFDPKQYIRGLDNPSGGYEFVSLGLPIHADFLKVEGALKGPQVYRGLKIDLSNNKFFDITKIGIDVFEVTEDINTFVDFDQIRANVPPTTKNPEDQSTIIDPNHPYSNFYEVVDGKASMLTDYKYPKTSYKERRLKELFQFDDEVFKNSLKDDPSKVELAFRIHKNFNDADPLLQEPEAGYNIIRVDFRISEFSDKTVNELSSFSWPSMWKSGQLNTGFNTSVQQAIKATQPRDKVVHTVFLKFNRE